MELNFRDDELVKKYGSWVRVQVEFYDFLFETGSQLCAEHFREETVAAEILLDGAWADGNPIYEKIISAIEERFKSPQDAWERFIAEQSDSE